MKRLPKASSALAFLAAVFWLSSVEAITKSDVTIHTKNILGSLNIPIQDVVNSTQQVLIQFRVPVGLIGSHAFRVHSSSDSAHIDRPLDVVVRQEDTIMSWALPLALKQDHQTHTYNSVNRTLCPTTAENRHGKKTDDGLGIRDIVITVSTSSGQNLSFEIILYQQDVFLLTELEKPTSGVATPSMPVFYQFNWSSNSEDNSSILPETVLLKFQSGDKICAVVRVQEALCPVNDMEWNVKFEGTYQTADHLAGLSVTREKFPNGVFIVVVINSNDESCSTYKELDAYGPRLEISMDDLRQKHFNLTLSNQLTRSEYLVAIFGAIGIFLSIYALVFIISCVLIFKGHAPGNGQIITENNANFQTVNQAYGDTETTEVGGVEIGPGVNEGESGDQIGPAVQNIIRAPTPEDAADTDDESEPASDIDFRTKRGLYVRDLARKPERKMKRKITLYHWNLRTIAIFYTLPVIQLMVTYQKISNSTGDQDLCYYNYLCAHPFGVLSDFNHVYSNLGYVMLGILFMAIVFLKERKAEKLRRQYLNAFEAGNHRLLFEPQYGVPQYYGILYAMGLALIMEGIMSGCYHVCPNHTNFQFDTAFMYTISILILMKIYQSRHPDITANAYSAFFALAFVIFVGTLGILDGSLRFWVAFTVLHVTAGIILSLQVYYKGRFKIDRYVPKRLWLMVYEDGRALLWRDWPNLKPLYPDRLILLLVMNGVNWGLAGYGLKVATEGLAAGTVTSDFASHLLTVFISNVMLYTSFYIVMKLRHGERLGLQPFLYLLFSMMSWGGAGYFFFNKSTSWYRAPAQSRALNMECELLHFYDNHDIWHFLSAISLFLGFMTYLTWDDDLRETRRDKIPVF